MKRALQFTLTVVLFYFAMAEDYDHCVEVKGNYLFGSSFWTYFFISSLKKINYRRPEIGCCNKNKMLLQKSKLGKQVLLISFTKSFYDMQNPIIIVLLFLHDILGLLWSRQIRLREHYKGFSCQHRIKSWAWKNHCGNISRWIRGLYFQNVGWG